MEHGHEQWESISLVSHSKSKALPQPAELQPGGFTWALSPRSCRKTWAEWPEQEVWMPGPETLLETLLQVTKAAHTNPESLGPGLSNCGSQPKYENAHLNMGVVKILFEKNFFP